jgi:hypothetical protein
MEVEGAAAVFGMLRARWREGDVAVAVAEGSDDEGNPRDRDRVVGEGTVSLRVVLEEDAWEEALSAAACDGSG